MESPFPQSLSSGASAPTGGDRRRPIVLPAPAGAARSVIDLTANGVAVFALAPGSKHPLRGSNGFTDATGDTCSALAMLVACTGHDARPDRFDLLDAEVEKTFADALAAAPAHAFEAVLSDEERIALYTRLVDAAAGVPCTPSLFADDPSHEVGPPRLNLGIRTGPGSGLIVIDYDPRKDPDGSQWRAVRPQLPDTFATRTRDDGWHFYFRWPPALDTHEHEKALAGYDAFEVKGRGGYVLAVPSAIKHKREHTDRRTGKHYPATVGGHYRFAGDYTYSDLCERMLPLPDALLQRLLTRQRVRAPTGANGWHDEGIAAAFEGFPTTNQDLGARCDLPDTNANRAWRDALIEFAYQHRRRDTRGKWHRDDWWSLLAMILTTGWADDVERVEAVSRRDAGGWDKDVFDKEVKDIQARHASGDKRLCCTWRALRWELRKQGYRGRINPPDLPLGDHLVTWNMSDAEVVEELLAARHEPRHAWCVEHRAAYMRIRPMLKKEWQRRTDATTDYPTKETHYGTH